MLPNTTLHGMLHPTIMYKKSFQSLQCKNVFCFVWYSVTVLRCYLHLRWHYFDALASLRELERFGASVENPTLVLGDLKVASHLG